MQYIIPSFSQLYLPRQILNLESLNSLNYRYSTRMPAITSVSSLTAANVAAAKIKTEHLIISPSNLKPLRTRTT